METSYTNDLLKPGNSVHLEFYDQSGRKIIYKTSIRDLDGDQLTFFIPQNDDALKSTEPGTKFTVVCRSDREEQDYVFTAEFVETRQERPQLVLTKPNQLEFSVGRRFFRCEVRLPFQLFNHDKKFPAEIINLSANGLFANVSPDLILDPGTILTCQIVLPTSPNPILFVGKVVRVIKKERYQGVGINFENITKSLQDQITKYLFQRQRALINLGQIKIVKSS